MSIEALNWAWEQTAPTSTAKLVLVALANHANSDNECWPKMSYIAERAQCSPRQVSRCVDALESAGMLAKKRRRMTAGRLGSYVFQLPVGQQQLPDTSDQTSPTSSGHPRPVDTDDQWTPTTVTTGHPRPSPPDTSVRTEPSVEPSLNPHSSDVPSDPEVSEDARGLTRQLALALKANGHKVPPKGRKAHREWLVAMDRLLRLDGADADEVAEVIRWATEDLFWRANVQSAPKFREKYPQLRLKMLGEREPVKPRQRQDAVAAKFGEGFR